MAPRSRKMGRSVLNAQAMPAPKMLSSTRVATVICQLSQNRPPSATIAVRRPPTICTMPVPMRLRMPSASFTTREISTPLCVLSKNDTGRRMRRACTLRRSWVMARWPATLMTWESPNEVAACTSDARPTASASGSSRSKRFAHHLVHEPLGAGRSPRTRRRG